VLTEVDADAATSPKDGRFVVLLLDDTTPAFAYRIKQVAREFADRMSGFDVVAVLALNGDADTTTTDRNLANRQIDKFKPDALALRATTGTNRCPKCGADVCADCGVLPGPSGVSAPGQSRHALETIASVAKQLAKVEHRRKTIVYIGKAPLFDLSVNEKSPLYGKWLDAIREASRADVSVDVIYVNALSYEPRPNGFAGETGGRTFVSNDVGWSVEQIWQAAGHYYLLGYDPSNRMRRRWKIFPRRQTHEIRVRVQRPGVVVHARRIRS